MADGIEKRDVMHCNTGSAGSAGVGLGGSATSTETIVNELFKYHAPDAEQMKAYETLRDTAKLLATVIIKNCPAGADRTSALRKLRESVMTANASIALNGLSF